MRRWGLSLLAAMVLGLSAGCGGEQPEPAAPLSPQDERKYQQEVERAAQQERGSPAGQ